MTDIKFSIIDANEWTKPVEKLIDSVSSAIGTAYEPTRIKKEAKAKAEALIIKKKAEIEVKELEDRATNRFNNTEIRRQNNIEQIVKEAAKHLPKKVSNKKVQEDWIFQFFNECQDIGNKKMQFIWSNILADEVANPGSFSYRTLSIVKLLNSDEAQLFSEICNYVWEYDDRKILVEPPIDKFELIKLEAAGLISVNDWMGFKLRGRDKFELNYFDEKILVELKEGSKVLLTGQFALTNSAKELLDIIEAHKNKSYFKGVLKKWLENDHKIHN